MPGMGAKSDIFNGLRFPKDLEIHPMEWLLPEAEEDFLHYAARLVDKFRVEPDSVLVGMSLGGVMVSEIGKLMPVYMPVFISTVKSHKELSPRYRMARVMHLWNFLPYGLIARPERLKPYVILKTVKKRIRLYERYMGIHDRAYFKWAIKNFLLWKHDLPDGPYLHIHGTRDYIFPYSYLKGEIIPVEGAAHLAVMTHPFAINRILREHLFSQL